MNADISNADILDLFKRAFWFRTDLEVANSLDVNKETVSQIRRGLMGISINQRLKIMNRLVSISVPNLLLSISNESLGSELAKKNNKPILNQIADDKLIEMFKEYGLNGGLFFTDKEMADVLGLKRASISGIRYGANLGSLPRIRMLKAIHSEIDIDQVLNGIDSNQSLYELIDKHIKIKSTRVHENI